MTLKPKTIPVSVLSAFISIFAFGGEPPKVHPKVLEMKVPTCPPLARIAGISGKVTFLVQTDGEKITEILKSEGPPQLQNQLVSQVMSWQFEKHNSLKFTITFEIAVIRQKPCEPSKPDEISMTLPSLLKITAYSSQECDPVDTAKPKQ